MYYISDAFNTACNDYVRTWHSKCVVNEGKQNEITLYNGVTENCLGAMTWESSINTDDSLAMGQTGMDKLTIEITRIQNNYGLQNATLNPYVGIEIDGETVWCPLGKFYIDDVTTDDNYFKTTVTAYDGMSLLSGTFDETEILATFPISARDLLEKIATHFGLRINETTYTILRSLEGYILRDSLQRILVVDSLRQDIGEVFEGTYRDYIGWIAGLKGCNAHFDRDGSISFSWYGESKAIIEPTVIYTNGLTLNKGGTVTYTSLLSGSEENPVTPTKFSGNAITFLNPYITAKDLDSIGENILPLTYQPCEVHYRGNPCIDVGDRITVNDAKGNSHNVFVMQRVLSMTGGLDDTIQCFGMTEEQQVLNQSPTQRTIKQVYNRLQDAVKNASDYINNTRGVFEWIDNGDGTNAGFNIISANGTDLIRATAGGLGVSLDGGQTFTNAITKDGINASVITTGTLNATDILIEQIGGNSTIKIENGALTIYDGDNKKIGEYSASGAMFSNSGKIVINDASGNKVTEISPSGGEWYDSSGNLAVGITANRTAFYKDGSLVGRILALKTSSQNQLHVETSGGENDVLVLSSADSSVQLGSSGLWLRHSEGIYFSLKTSSTTWSTMMTVLSGEVNMYSNLDMNGYSILNQSDIRLKENIDATPITALDTIDAMRFVQFDWKKSKEHEDLGVIAQELQKVNPSMVVEDEDGMLSVNTSKFIMYSLKAIQELSAEVKRLKGEDANG